MTDCSIVNGLAPLTIAECHIAKDEDWLDQLPQFLDGDLPTDLTGVTVEIYIRPVFDSVTLIKKLSTADGNIVVDDVENGMLSINMARADVIAQLPIGVWDHFCIQSQTESPNGVPRTVYRERFRGPLVVHPGRI